MSYKKSQFLSSLNKSKTKSFVLNKCINIKKSIFSCKSTHNQMHGGGNYEFIGYGEMTTLQHTANTTEPISSTIIENQLYNPNELINPAFESSRVDDISKISFSNEITICNNNNDDNENTEVTRNTYYSVCNETTSINYESLTIVNEPKKQSPINQNQYFKSNQLDTSINSISECLHSTKISSDYSYYNFQNLSPKQTLDLSSSLTSLNDSPVLSSSHIESDHVPTTAATNQLSMIDSLLSNLSTTTNKNNTSSNENNETRVCTTNYEATFVDDVSVQFADTVRILKDNNDEWLYVQVMDDGRTGFVPRTIVLDLNQFIQQLRKHRDQLTKSKVSLLDFPIKV